MKRKVIQIADSTQLVSLPRQWAKQQGIKKGDEIEVEVRGSTITIKAGESGKPDLGKVIIDVSGLDRSSIMFAIRAAYRKGYDEIEVHFQSTTAPYYRIGKDLKVISIIHEEVNRLIGIEIIHQQEHSCIIKSVSEVDAKEFDVMLRKIFLLLIDASRDILTGIKNNDRVMIETVEEKHNTVTKFISYCLRVLNKRGHPDYRNTNFYYHIIATLDKLMDVVKYSARDILAYPKQISMDTVKLLEMMHHSLELYYELFYNFQMSVVTQLYKNRDLVRNKADDKLKSLTSAELLILYRMEQNLELLVDLTEVRMSIEF